MSVTWTAPLFRRAPPLDWRGGPTHSTCPILNPGNKCVLVLYRRGEGGSNHPHPCATPPSPFRAGGVQTLLELVFFFPSTLRQKAYVLSSVFVNFFKNHLKSQFGTFFESPQYFFWCFAPGFSLREKGSGTTPPGPLPPPPCSFNSLLGGLVLIFTL